MGSTDVNMNSKIAGICVVRHDFLLDLTRHVHCWFLYWEWKYINNWFNFKFLYILDTCLVPSKSCRHTAHELKNNNVIINWRSVNIGIMYVPIYMSRFDIGDLVSPEVKLCVCVLNEPLKWNSHSMVIYARGEEGHASSFYPWAGWNPFVKVLMSLMG